MWCCSIPMPTRALGPTPHLTDPGTGEPPAHPLSRGEAPGISHGAGSSGAVLSAPPAWPLPAAAVVSAAQRRGWGCRGALCGARCLLLGPPHSTRFLSLPSRVVLGGGCAAGDRSHQPPTHWCKSWVGEGGSGQPGIPWLPAPCLLPSRYSQPAALPLGWSLPIVCSAAPDAGPGRVSRSPHPGSLHLIVPSNTTGRARTSLKCP